MKKWSNSAKRRLVEIQADESAADMRAIAEAFAKLPPGQLKKMLNDDIITILVRYGVVF